MQALVICEKYDSEADKQKLFSELRACGIEPFVSESMQLDPVLNALRSMNPDKPFLYYPNIWTRYDRPDGILGYHAANPGFEALLVDGERVSFFPLRVKVYYGTFVINSDMLDRAQDGYTFYITNCHKRTLTPNASPFPIFMYSHNRAAYFQLSLNALKHSLKGDLTNVKLFLNEPTEDVLNVAKRSGADTFIVEKNSFYSVINLAVQWFKPKQFMICEDDFILPPHVDHYFPNWYSQFSQRLEKFDMVGWAPSIENGPPKHRFRPLSSTLAFSDWVYHNTNPKPLLLGQALAVNYSFWKKALMSKPSPWKVPLDTDLHRLNPKFCTPVLRGYHIGWNQEMDGIGTTVDSFVPPEENHVTHLQTGERRSFIMEDIYKNDFN